MKRVDVGLAPLLVALLLGASTVRPVTAGTTDTRSVTFDTSITPQLHGAGAYEGILHLTFGPRGFVNGWYRPVDDGRPRDVVGGLDGKTLWLDLGEPGLHDIQSTYDGSKIVGATYIVDQPFTFVATPTTKQP